MPHGLPLILRPKLWPLWFDMIARTIMSGSVHQPKVRCIKTSTDPPTPRGFLLFKCGCVYSIVVERPGGGFGGGGGPSDGEGQREKQDGVRGHQAYTGRQGERQQGE